MATCLRQRVRAASITPRRWLAASQRPIITKAPHPLSCDATLTRPLDLDWGPARMPKSLGARREFSSASVVRRWAILAYCVLAFGFLWIPFGMVTWGSGQNAEAWSSALAVLGPYGPLVAAVIVRALGREGFRDARLGTRAVPVHVWGAAVTLPLFWNATQDAMSVGLGFATVSWTDVPRGLYRVPINLVGGLFIFIGEEFGWRSYLLERLKPLGRRTAVTVSALIWSVWHVPLVVVPNGYYGAQADPIAALLALASFALLGMIFGWLYLEGGSVWPCVLMHSWNNLITMKLLTEAWTQLAPLTLRQQAAMALIPIGLVCICLAVGLWTRRYQRRCGRRTAC